MLSVPLLVTTLLVAAPATEPDPPPSAQELRAAIERSLVFLEKSAVEWWEGNTHPVVQDGHPVLVKGTQKNCGSCHHLPSTVWTLTEARQRGFVVEGASLDQLRDWALAPYIKDPERKPVGQDKFGGGHVSLNTIYLSWAASAAEKPDEQATDALRKFAAHLVEKQESDGSWSAGRTGYEPPIGDITEALTMQALLVLAEAHERGFLDDASWNQSRDRAVNWLAKNPPGDRHQSLVLEALLAQRFGKRDEAQSVVKRLLAGQNADGGWSQLKELPSDALATGQTLYVLDELGIAKEEPAAVQRAQAYLLRTQKPDGSWWVPSRDKGRKGLAISHYGSAWATLGLIRSLP